MVGIEIVGEDSEDEDDEALVVHSRRERRAKLRHYRLDIAYDECSLNPHDTVPALASAVSRRASARARCA